jgi:pectate lyase
MKFSLISILSLALVATASPSEADYSLIGFAKDNPVGPTIYAKGNFNLTSRLRPGSNKV